MSTTTVLVVDDHAIVRAGYHRLLESRGGISVVGEAATGAAGYQAFCELSPDVVVMDLALPGASGIEAMRRMLARESSARVLIFSMYEDAVFVRRALQAGARGYLSKASAPEELIEAVLAVAAGRRYLSRDVAQALALTGAQGESLAADGLSLRELEVLQLLAQGLGSAEIGAQLGINPKTVANYQSAIKQKLGADNTVQLLRIAAQHGILGDRGGSSDVLPRSDRD